MPSVLAFLVGAGLILLMLWEAFNTVILPRQVTGMLPVAFAVYRGTWAIWRFIAHPMPDGEEQEITSNRDKFLSLYGPLALLMLLVVWALLLIFGFALIHWSFGSQALTDPQGAITFGGDLYFSGVTFFTLGFGDILPTQPIARLTAVVEAGTGFAFLALVIGYIPVFYQSFARRETVITMLDTRAGSPPSAAEFLVRYKKFFNNDLLNREMEDWERWAAEILESHLSFPIMMWYRSQHEHQSWLTTLTFMLDTCALLLTSSGCPQERPRVAFAMARHAAVDLCQVVGIKPHKLPFDRLSPAKLAELQATLCECGIIWSDTSENVEQLNKLRAMYEPYVYALSEYLLLQLPHWLPKPDWHDAWSTTPYDEPVKLSDLSVASNGRATVDEPMSTP